MNVSTRPPPPRRTTEGFTPYAVPTRSGPHVTIQATAELGGRVWTTSSRDSLKTRSVRAHGVTSMVRPGSDGRVRVVTGRTVTLDPLRPDPTVDPFGSVLAGPAVADLVARQLPQVVGYLESACAVPSEWLPHRRVLLVTRIDRSLELDGYTVAGADGSWADEHAPLLPTTGVPTHPLPPLPEPFRDLPGVDRPARVGFTTVDGPVVLPARWRGEDRFDVSASALARIDALLPGLACATFDSSADRRPEHKRGVIFRGAATLVDVEDARATVSLSTRKITTWDGFDAATFEPAAEHLAVIGVDDESR